MINLSAKLRPLLPFALIIAATTLFYYDLLMERSVELEITTKFFSFLFLSVGWAWLYTQANNQANSLSIMQTIRQSIKHPLKLLDWALCAFCLSMMIFFQVLGLPLTFWVILLSCCVLGRILVAWWVQGKEYLKPYAKIGKQLKFNKIFLYVGIALFIVPIFGFTFYYMFSERYGLPIDSRFFIKAIIVKGILVEPERLTPLAKLIIIACLTVGIILCIISRRKSSMNISLKKSRSAVIYGTQYSE